MLRIAAALGLALHGLIHLIGFVVPWRLAEISGVPSMTSAVWGRVELSDTAARALGLGWAAAAAGFLVAAIGVWIGTSWGPGAVVAATTLSLAVCVAGSPASLPGLVIDALILASVGVYVWSTRAQGNAP